MSAGQATDFRSRAVPRHNDVRSRAAAGAVAAAVAAAAATGVIRWFVRAAVCWRICGSSWRRRGDGGRFPPGRTSVPADGMARPRALPVWERPPLEGYRRPPAPRDSPPTMFCNNDRERPFALSICSTALNHQYIRKNLYSTFYRRQKDLVFIFIYFSEFLKITYLVIYFITNVNRIFFLNQTMYANSLERFYGLKVKKQNSRKVMHFI